MLYVELFGGVVDGAVLVVVVADGAVEHVVLQDAVEGFALGDVDGLACGDYVHAGGDVGGAGAGKFAVDLDHAGVAALDGAHLRDVADLRDGFLHAGFAVRRLRRSMSSSPECAGTAAPSMVSCMLGE